MSLLGTHLQVLIGPGVPLPAPLPFLEAIRKVEVHVADEGRSGFQISLKAGRRATDLVDEPLLLLPQVRIGSRVVLTVNVGAVPAVIMDGVVTNVQHSPGEAGESTITLTGEDVSMMMDLEERTTEHPAQPENVIALKIIATYASYGLVPVVIPPVVMDTPIPLERTPMQQGTDLEYLNDMASRHGYVFYVKPGPVPLANVAYWGPPEKLSVPQRALSVHMGSFSNVLSFNVEHDGLASTRVSGSVQDRRTGETMPVETFAVTRPPLAAQPAWLTQSQQRVLQFRESGRDALQAMARAQALADQAADRVVGATGELDVARYGGLLSPRGVVGVRGMGWTGDGLYYVKSVTHLLERGRYRQQFNLQREGTGALSPVVVP